MISEKEKILYMSMAKLISTQSTCKRRQVGCVIVLPTNQLLIGYNGTPPGWDNCCEDEHGFTLSHVLHAEHNAIEKATDPKILKGSSVFVSYGPCVSCCELLNRYNIKELFYAELPTKYVEILHLEQCNFASYHLPL